MENYELLREDWDSILELAQFTGRPEIASQIPSKVSPGSTRWVNPLSKVNNSLKGFYQNHKIHLVRASIPANNVWQSKVEIKHYSVAYFDRVTTFEVL